MTPTITPRLRTWVLLLLAVTGALLAGAAPASAHAALTGSDPAQGVVVATAPQRVSLTFSEQVAMNASSVRVLDPRGRDVVTGAPDNVGGTTYAVGLRSGLAKGTYTVAYQVVSADSHPVAGAYTFSVGAPSKTVVSGAAPDAGGGVIGVLYAFGRYVSYAGFTVLAGGAAFVLVCWRRGAGVRPVQRLVVGGWVALTAATLWLLLLRGSYTTSGSAADVFDLNLLGQVLQTKTGAALVSRLLLLAAAALFVAVLFGTYQRREEGEEKRDLTFGLAVGGFVVAAGLAASWAMAEHASTGLQPGIAMPVDVLHLLAVAAWLGGLTTLLTALYRAPAETPVEAAAVRRFSRLAFGAVLVLVATGTYQSWRQLGSWSAFTDTTYGELLLVKIALVAVLVGIAWFSRRWVARLTDPATDAADTVSGETAVPARRSGRPGKTAVTTAGKAAVSKRTEQTEQTAEKEAADTGTAATGGGERAAQLARQRAAVAAARQRRERDADPVRSGLRRSVLTEAGVAVVLLAVTTWLTQTEPGRTEQEARAATGTSVTAPADGVSGAVTLDMRFDTGGKDGKGLVRIDLDPARVGTNEMHVYVQRPDGRPYDVPEVKVAFTLAAKKIGPLPVTPEHIVTGHWSADKVQIPIAGDWQVAVSIRTSDIDQTTVSKNAQIG
ncbi:copper resistance protein CopC [Streptomyces sp. J2-1]|uniref:copper resistance CopC/CopD family protein n=1 Tax=Streptomyces corallincola TaxID=2851888 RepID=UPI001C392B5D|nr:copper resistance protein CopC [Streptomyces corallincola]MBV2354776.1 copper resistance protein CopC [Streptomyces corallincola]